MSNSQTQDGRSEQAAEQRRRKRRERAAKSRAPEPKDIVSGAGQPLDPGVRRELEEQLGHDLSRVRLHTDRDAGQLTELLGADAVAVGQDVFFREGAFKPGTDEGRRLLAHELLHTVQNPHGLGTLRAGRELGAVSLPQQAIEREAESAAQDLVRPSATGPEQPAPEVAEDQATPGWLRYATVDADRNRAEAMDPATLVDRLANSVVRSLRGDPEDLSQRTRKQLSRLPEELLDGVLVRLENRLLAPEHDRVLDLVDEIEAYDDHADDLERNAHDAPEIEPDVAEDVRTERENALRAVEEQRAEEDRPQLAPGPEKEQADEEGAAGSTPRNGGTPENGTTPEGGGAPRGSGQRAPGAQGAAPGVPAPQKQQSSSSSASGGSSGGGQQGEKQSVDPTGRSAGHEKGGEQAEEGDKGGQEETEQKETPAASKEESAAKNRPGAAEAAVAGRQLNQQDRRGQQQPTGSPTMSGKDTPLPGAFSTLDGTRTQDLDGREEKTDEDPFGSGSDSEVEVGGEEPSAWDVKLRPEDFVPEQDLEVSAVPTADELDPSSASTAQSAPSFPAPAPTRAEQVQAEREAEDAEDTAAEPDDEAAESDTEPEPSAEETEGSPDGGAGPDGLAVEQAAAAPHVPGNRDPKNGDDPKAGPVAAQTTVQEAPGKAEGKSEGGSEAKESAAKEETGTAAAGDKGTGGQEKESQKATGGQSAQGDAAAKASGGAGAGSADAGGPQTQGAQGAGSAQDVSAVGGGATAPGVSSGSATSGASDVSGPSGGESAGEAPAAQESRTEPKARTQAPAPTLQSAPAAPASEPASTKAAPEEKAEPESAPAPKAAPTGASRGGGGGGGAAAPARGKGKKDSGPVPNLSGVSPEAGLATASKLKPHKALQAMGGVGGAVDRSVGDEHEALASAPPSMQRPVGAPQTLEGRPETDAPAEYSQDKPEEAQAPEQENAEVTGAKEPEGQIEAEKAEEPGGWDTFKMALGFIGGKIVNGVASLFGADEPVVDPQELAAKFAGLPTKDEALKQAQAGNAPGVEMKGAAEQTAGEQDGHVDAKGQETVRTARDDSGRGMGEDQVYPNAPKEEMTAQVPGAQGGEGVAVEGGGATGAVPPEAASEVAEHEQGPQFQAAFSDGTKKMSDGRQTKDRDFRDSQARHKQQVDAEIASNTESQAGEREKAMGEVTAQREDWRKEQDEELKTLGDKKTERHDKVRKDVEDEEKKTDDNVDTEKEGSDKKIQDESDKAERDAEQQRDGAVQDSGNWVTKAFEWIKQKVIEIKNAIVRVIRAARDAVIGFIKNFKETVERWINEARKNIVDAIKNLIKDLIEFAMAMIRAVIELADRIRTFITNLIAAAIALVNRLAQALKQAVTDLLNAIGKLLSSILDILKKALLEAVKAIVAAVKAVLEFASKLLSALGAWMMIAVDFLSDPGGWLSGAKNSAVDGAKNHLFREVSSAVKAWFQEKIQEIIGVPKAIIDKLIKGGFSLDRIVKEAWNAVVPQLPMIIGELVMTKVVAKLIPGAGWVMAVIDAIRTAWGALSAILSSLGAVLDWLKAVRVGGAGLLFAKAVAAGVVALLEVLYQALLNGIGKYVAKVGRRLKGVAAKLGKGKGDKPGGGKGAGAEGSDDRGGDKKPQDSTAKKPGTEGTAQTAAAPKPGQGKDGAPGKPKTAGEAQTPTASTAKDKNGRPKDNDEKPDTSPTPTVKPKPKPEPPDRPKSEPEPGAKPKKDGDSTAPKDRDKDSARPKDDGRDPSKPKDDTRDPNRPKDDGKDTPGRPKTGKDPDRPGRSRDKDGDKDGDKPGRPKKKDDEGRQRKPEHEGSGPKKPKRDRHEDRRSKDKDAEEKKQQKKDQRKKEEESKDSKDARLAKIVARLRPPIGRLLGKGVQGMVLRGTLAGLRAWHRLTSLTLESGDVADIIARLNPQVRVTQALTLSERELLDLLDEVAYEILDAPVTAEGAERIAEDPQRSTEKSRHFRVPAGVGFASVARFMRSQGDRMAGHQDSYVTDFFEYEHDSGESSTVAHYTKGESERIRNAVDRRIYNSSETATDYANNRAAADDLHLQRGLVKRLRQDGSSERELRYLQRKNRGPEPNVADRLMSTAQEGQALAGDVEQMTPGGRIPGQAGRDAAFFGTLALAKEAHRNPRALVTSGMILQIASQGDLVAGVTPSTAPEDALAKMQSQRGTAFPMGDALAYLPMEQQGAMKSFGDLEQQRSENPQAGAQDEFRRKGPKTLANREILALQLWIKSLDIKTDSGGEIKTKEQLREQIRRKMAELYGL
ncbi:eCIS core domain-containing protein [Streptomyces sp. NPDC002577]